MNHRARPLPASWPTRQYVAPQGSVSQGWPARRCSPEMAEDCAPWPAEACTDLGFEDQSDSADRDVCVFLAKFFGSIFAALFLAWVGGHV